MYYSGWKLIYMSNEKKIHAHVHLVMSIMYVHLCVSLFSLSGDSDMPPGACGLLAGFASVQVFIWLQQVVGSHVHVEMGVGKS